MKGRKEMEKYISLDRALELMKGFTDRKNGNPHFFYGLETYREYLEHLGETDGIEMVKCKNCAHCDENYCEVMDARVIASRDACPWGFEI